MTNENSNTNAPRVTLTPDQIKARDLALAAAKANQPVETKPTVQPVTVEHKPVPGVTVGPVISAMPGTATTPSKPTDKALPVAPVTTAPAEKPTGGQPTAVTTVTKAKGKADKAKPETKVTAAKPPKLTPREAALANDKLVRGYDFSKWPKAMAAIMPTVDIIDAVRATGVLKTYITKTELALCVYCMPDAQRYNVYDVATALQNVCGGSHDHKMNTVNQKAVPSKMFVRINPGARAVGLTDGKALVAYGVAPSTQGLTKIKAVLGDRTPKHWLPETGPSKASDKGKGVTATTAAHT